MNPTTTAAGITIPSTADIHQAALEAAAEPIQYGRHIAGGRLPSPRTAEFVNATLAVRRATLLILGEAWLVEDPRTPGLPFDAAAPGVEDYIAHGWHRTNTLIELTPLQRRRWGPTGDREQWIRHGNPADQRPAPTPDPELERAFAAARARQTAAKGSAAA